MSLCSVWLSWGRSWQQSSAGRRHFSYTSCLTRRSSQPAAGKSTARSKRQFQPRRNTNLPTPDKLNPFLPSTWEPRAAFALQPHQDPLDLVATYAIALAQPDSPVISTLAQTLGLPVNELEHLAQRWKQETSFGSSIPENFSRIKHLAVSEGLLAIHQAVLQHFLAWSIRSTHASVTTRAALQRLHNHTNYTRPESWRPLARRYHRKVILHVGPTNSGKTHQALAALAQARTGVYAGPLRLLAHEVYTRFNKGNIGGLIRPRACNLVTGEEQRIVAPISATETILSCTVEMIPHNKLFDVVVIDEIQMIADTDRGDAWTNAFLNVHANEIHLCGEERAVHLIERLAELTGDEVEVRRYQRLSGLEVSTKSLRGDLSKVERGDCIVTFSRNNIFALKQAVEKQTNLKVVVAYGGLPPEVREEQARIFNEEAGADVMIASDAIGMGLNLKIKRVIFESMHKWNGGAIVALTLPQVKQIGGRAGRYGMHSPTPGNSVADLDNDIPTQPQPSVGQVTTLDPEDLPLLKKAMAASVSPIQRAVIMPHAEQLSSLSKVVASGVPFSRILALARMFGRTSPNYTLPIHAASIIVTALLDKYSQLTPEELRTLAVAPVSTRDDRGVETFQCFVQSHVDSKPFNLVEWAHQQGLSDLLPGHVQTTSPSAKQVAAISGGDLLSLESCHKSMSLYLWLSYRLPLTFDQPEIARGLRRNIEKAIDAILSGRTAWERKKAQLATNVTQPPSAEFETTADQNDPSHITL